MTTIMREVPGHDSFLSGAAESNQSGTSVHGGVLGGGTDHELARVVPATPSRAADSATAACAPAPG